MSSTATMLPSASSTGRWRKWLSIIMISASVALSSIRTHFGFFVMIASTDVDGSTSLATTRRIMSVLVTMPARQPLSPVSRAESVLAAAIAFDTSRTLEAAARINGFFGRSRATDRSFSFTCSTADAFEALRTLLIFDCFDRREPMLRIEPVSDSSSSTSIVCSQNVRHPPLPSSPSPMVAFITSTASTMPFAAPSSTIGRCRNFSWCMWCRASRSDM
mmetsp:Transcript_107153/g.311154  ORF Transcript_107153/g.311154 Transcript_107153/m.311154 type:complete len:218 (+) Transcript_107153:1-654(+)